MTIEKCQELHIIGIGQPEINEWYCIYTKRKISRWIICGYQSMIRSENPNAINLLCDCCEIPNQD